MFCPEGAATRTFLRPQGATVSSQWRCTCFASALFLGPGGAKIATGLFGPPQGSPNIATGVAVRQGLSLAARNPWKTPPQTSLFLPDRGGESRPYRGEKEKTIVCDCPRIALWASPLDSSVATFNGPAGAQNSRSNAKHVRGVSRTSVESQMSSCLYEDGVAVLVKRRKH